MLRALAAGVIVGLICPAIGIFLVVRKLSLIGEGLGHASFAGVAIGWLLGTYPVVTAMVFAGLMAAGIEKLRSLRKTQGDVAIGIFLYTGLALGVVLVSLGRSFSVDLYSYLFGSIVTVTGLDLLLMAGLGIVIFLVLSLFFKEFFCLALDADSARAGGIPAGFLNMLLIILTAMTVAVSMRVVGILLVSALMVVPVAAGMQVAKSFRGALFVSMVFSVQSVLAGLVVSFYFNLAPGGAIVLFAVIIFAVTLFSGSTAFLHAIRGRSMPASFPVNEKAKNF